MPTTPTRFEHLPVAELRRSAIEDFAVEINDTDSKDVVVAALFDAGVNWSDYVKQHPEVLPEQPKNVVTATPPTTPPAVAAVVEEPIEILVQEELVAKPNQRMLIKMERDNQLFQVRGYTFTSEHPFQLVIPSDGEYILTHETGFRQAFPSEARDLYTK